MSNNRLLVVGVLAAALSNSPVYSLTMPGDSLPRGGEPKPRPLTEADRVAIEEAKYKRARKAAKRRRESTAQSSAVACPTPKTCATCSEDLCDAYDPTSTRQCAAWKGK